MQQLPLFDSLPSNDRERRQVVALRESLDYLVTVYSNLLGLVIILSDNSIPYEKVMELYMLAQEARIQVIETMTDIEKNVTTIFQEGQS